MRRKVAVFIMLTFFVAILGVDYKPQSVEDKPDAYEVVKYMEGEVFNYPNDNNDFYLLFDSYKLDTKNFVQVFSYLKDYDYDILEVYPYINPMYQQVLNNVYKIKYNSNSLNEGILSIYNTYMRELEKYRLSDEIDKVLVNGMKIRIVKVNLNNEVLGKFIDSHKSVKYSLTPYGLLSPF